MAKKTKKNKLSKKERAELALTIYELKTDGFTDEEIMDELSIDDVSVFNGFITDLLKQKEEEVRKPAGEIYVRYKMQQERNIKDLDELVRNLDEKKQYNAVIGAIRLRADIEDRILKTGQELGVISKAPKQVNIFGGIALADLTTDDLRGKIVAEMTGLQGLMEQFGEQDIKQLTAGPTHFGDAIDAYGETVREKVEKVVDRVVKKATDKKNRAKGSKRSAGRRRMRVL